MPLKRFGSNTNFSSDSLLLFENFGLTVYLAQSYEQGLQNVVTGLDRLGAITVPPGTPRSGDGFVNTCLGDMFQILYSQGTIDRKSRAILKRAHRQRNVLIHGFIAKNMLYMVNSARRASLNDRLYNIYSNLRLANAIVLAISEEIFDRLGRPREQVQREVDELRRLSDNPGRW
jgi:hypothetical protein